MAQEMRALNVLVTQKEGERKGEDEYAFYM